MSAHPSRPFLRATVLLSACALLGACASAPNNANTKPEPVAAAITSPLNDLNLVQAAIPPVLLEAQKAPYAAPADKSCPALAAQVHALEEVLGPDLDTPATAANPGLVERSGKVVGDAASGALKSAAEGIIPFRGWVRKLSGAERYSKDVAAAIAAGTVRRAYLKGLGQERHCVWPAAPR